MVLKSIRLISSVNNGLSGITQLISISAVKCLSRPGKDGKKCVALFKDAGSTSSSVRSEKLW
jgi:hypothetical protein